ncbi:MAG: benzoyl-CoA reductase, bzd-type, subunit O [Dehalococcoidia bacterium]
MTEKVYKTKPLDCWQKAKELRLKYYQDYAAAHEKGGLRWVGGAWSFDAIPMGLGDDIYPLTSEPYGASIAHDPTFAVECQEACESKGFARDLCSYMRTYWGSILLNKYYFGGEFPKPDFIWQDHICCSHSKWYQVVSDLEGGIPFYSTDVSVGPYKELDENRLNYVVEQMLDGIEWLQKTTGRKYDDEKLIQAVYNDCRSTALWADICDLNKAIPAPLDEKSMFALYVLGTLHRSSKEIADFYEELKAEVEDRVANEIAAVPIEQCRLMGDSQPPWSFLSVYRYMERYGAVSIGSPYTFGLIGIWDLKDDGSIVPAQPPQKRGIKIESREQALRVLADWELRRIMWLPFYGADWKSQIMINMARDWHLNGVIIHLNRGCEGTCIGVMENRLALAEAGIPVLTYEGNMGDPREVDMVQTLERIDSFMENLGMKKLDIPEGAPKGG